MSSLGSTSIEAFQPAFCRVEGAIKSAIAQIAALPVTSKAELTIDLMIVIERALGPTFVVSFEEKEEEDD